jgi:1,4-dihydroxy-2-naphthoyl-CoA hydrolase
MSTFRNEIDCADLVRRGVGRFPGLVGIEIVAVEPRKVVLRLPLRAELLAPNGFLHGAVVVALADTACGYGALAHLPQGMVGC